MTRTGADATGWAHARVGPGPYPDKGMEDDGLCLKFTRQCFDVPSYYATAIDAWTNNPDQRTDRHPPPAVPVWFWSSSPARHVAFWDGSSVISTYNDDVKVYSSLSAAESVFGGFLGWSPQVNRVTVWEDDDMPSADEVAAAVWSYPIHRAGAPVSDAGTFLADTRVVVDQGTGPAIAPWVWDHKLPGSGSADYARNWLVVARQAPEVNGKLDTLLAEPSVTSRDSLLAFALALLISVIGGVAIGILASTRDGVIAGVSAIVGSVLYLVLRSVTRRGGRHRADAT